MNEFRIKVRPEKAGICDKSGVVVFIDKHGDDTAKQSQTKGGKKNDA